jgi:hypothetical protein
MPSYIEYWKAHKIPKYRDESSQISNTIPPPFHSSDSSNCRWLYPFATKAIRRKWQLHCYWWKKCPTRKLEWVPHAGLSLFVSENHCCCSYITVCQVSATSPQRQSWSNKDPPEKESYQSFRAFTKNRIVCTVMINSTVSRRASEFLYDSDDDGK